MRDTQHYDVSQRDASLLPTVSPASSPGGMLPPSEPILPPEVIDLIIDNLHDHRPTLRVCSLVSRNWLGGSRHHLFNGHGMYLTGRNLDAFRELLKSPHNTLSFHLRNLHATEFQYDHLTKLWPLLPRFSHLQSLHVHGNPIFDKDVLDAHIFPFIRSLSFSRAVFPSYHGLTTFLSRFPSLKTLKLDRVSLCSFTPGETTEITSSKFNLDVLQITLTPGLLGWLRWTGFSLRAQSMEIDFESIETGLSEYFHALGTQLGRLRLKFRHPGQLGTSFPQYLSLQSNNTPGSNIF